MHAIVNTFIYIINYDCCWDFFIACLIVVCLLQKVKQKQLAWVQKVQSQLEPAIKWLYYVHDEKVWYQVMHVFKPRLYSYICS